MKILKKNYLDVESVKDLNVHISNVNPLAKLSDKELFASNINGKTVVFFMDENKEKITKVLDYSNYSTFYKNAPITEIKLPSLEKKNLKDVDTDEIDEKKEISDEENNFGGNPKIKVKKCNKDTKNIKDSKNTKITKDPKDTNKTMSKTIKPVDKKIKKSAKLGGNSLNEGIIGPLSNYIIK